MAAREAGAAAAAAAAGEEEAEADAASQQQPASSSLLLRRSSSSYQGDQALRAREHQIGAAAAAEAAAAERHALRRASSPPPAAPAPAAEAAALGEEHAARGTAQEPEQPGAAIAAEAGGVGQPALCLQHEAGWMPVRRTQSASAVLMTAVHGQSGPVQQRSQGQSPPAAAAAQQEERSAAEFGAGVRPVRTGRGGSRGSSAAGTPRRRPAQEGEQRTAPRMPGTPQSGGELSQDGWRSESVSSGGEGYVTPESAGYDTPRSGMATPASERSGLSAGAGGREADVTPYRLQVCASCTWSVLSGCITFC